MTPRERVRIPRPYHLASSTGSAPYRPVGALGDPHRTASTKSIGNHSLLEAWAALRGIEVTGNDMEALSQLWSSVETGEFRPRGPLLDEFAYFLGDVLCAKYAGWTWNIDLAGYPVLVHGAEDPSTCTVWDVISYLDKKMAPGGPNFSETLAHINHSAKSR